MAAPIAATTNDHVAARLVDWISTTKRREMTMDLDVDLIRAGILDSLDMVNFLLFIEELRGWEIPEALIQPRYFVSLRVILETFFRDSMRAQQPTSGAKPC